MTSGEQLVVLSANCQGLQNKNKRLDVLDYFSKRKPSIVCLQDTHWTQNDESIVRSMWKGDCITNGRSSNSRGVAILLCKSFEYNITSTFKDNDGNLISLDLTIGDMSIKLINIYAPNKDSPEFFKNVRQIIESNQQAYIMVCGDLNLVLDPLLDCDQYKHINNPKSRQLILEIMNTFNVSDTFRLFHPNLRCYSWRRKRPLRQARLDYFLVSHPMHDIITECNINSGYRSDHSSVEVRLLLNKFKRGRGLWKLNCSLLKDKEYINLVNKMIQEEKFKYALPVYNLDFLSTIPDNNINFIISDGQFLEALLLRIRGETVKYASYQKKKDTEHEQRLISEIEILETGTEEMADELYEKKKELEKIRQKSIAASAVRARAQWLNEGEKPSKYFCSLEKSNYIEKTIKCIQLENGSKVTEQTEILTKIQAFYASLFSRKENLYTEHNLKELLKEKNVNKLTSEDSKSLEGKLSLCELSIALKQMKNYKCPGVDGFPAEFLKIFWGKLKHFIHRALNEAFDTGELSITLRTCIISCLPKGNKPREFLKNWRPISLLSSIYKVASTAIANRLKRVLSELISDTQTGFISGRFIGENTRIV